MTRMNAEIEKLEHKDSISPHMRLVLKIIGAILVPIGVAGVMLPILPGPPVLIVAAACFARSSPRLERWLVTHPVFGPGIAAWRERGAISLRSKIFSLSMMMISAIIIALSDAPMIAKAVSLIFMLGVAAFIVTRPNH